MRLMNKIKDTFNWLVFAQWYKGSDMGDGILVSLLSGCLFICLGIAAVIYIISEIF